MTRKRKGVQETDITEKSIMKPSEETKIQRHNNPVPEQKSWIDICVDSIRLAIPVGPRFQADLPALLISPGKHGKRSNFDPNSDSSKWLGIKVWPPIGGGSEEINDDLIGKGRPKSCLCKIPGTVECIREHITAKKIQLESDLGPAFRKWKFDEMGEDFSKSWNLEEQKKFEVFVKMHAKSQGKSFIKSALEHFPYQSRENIISYYLNVHILRRMSKQSRLGFGRIDTDDESEETTPSKGSRKRLQANSGASNVGKYVKNNYLMGRR